MKKQNILISTIGKNIPSLKVIKYFYQGDENNFSICRSFFCAEADAKYLLSKTKIDKIYLLGPKLLKDEHNLKCHIYKTGAVEKRDIEKLTIFQMLCYRMEQFINGVDNEAQAIDIDVKELLTDDRIEKIKDFVKNESNIFYKLNTDDKKLQELKDNLFDIAHSILEADETKTLTEKSKEYITCFNGIQSYFYSTISEENKMKALDENSELDIEYIEIDDDNDYVYGFEDFAKSLYRIINDPDCQYTVNVDTQEISSIDSHTLLTFISMAGTIRKNVDFNFLISFSRSVENFCLEIKDESEKYEITNLLTGIQSLIQHGKIDLIKDYCKSINYKSVILGKLLLGLEYIDAGVSLNNISDLQYGIQVIKLLQKQKIEDDANEYDSLAYSCISLAIKNDFAEILESDDIDILELIAWAFRKDYYQQALTMIESLTPDDFVKSGIYYYAKSENEIEPIMAHWNELYWKENSKNRYIYDDLDHMYIKSYGKEYSKGNSKDEKNISFAKLKIDQLTKANEKLILAYTNCTNNDLLYNLLYNYYNIGTLRNRVNHANSTGEIPTDTNNLVENKTSEELCSAIKAFINSYYEIRKNVNENKNASKPILISPSQFKEYRNAHKIEKDKSYKN